MFPILPVCYEMTKTFEYWKFWYLIIKMMILLYFLDKKNKNKIILQKVVFIIISFFSELHFLASGLFKLYN